MEVALPSLDRDLQSLISGSPGLSHHFCNICPAPGQIHLSYGAKHPRGLVHVAPLPSTGWNWSALGWFHKGLAGGGEGAVPHCLVWKRDLG